MHLPRIHPNRTSSDLEIDGCSAHRSREESELRSDWQAEACPTMLGTPFIRRMVVLSGALLLIVILGLLPERSFNRARDAEQLVTHTLRVINASGALLSIIESAETGERGYLLTGEERYLQPYQAALSSYRQGGRGPGPAHAGG